MRVLVMGGGVVGVTTAYQLLKDGHEVVLLERNAGVAQETSWGNAGMVAPGPFVRLVIAARALDSAEVAVPQGPGAALSILDRSAAVFLVG